MTSKLLMALAIGGLIAGTVPVYSQSGPVSPSGGQSDTSGSGQSSGDLTVDTVLPDDPWGDMEIDLNAGLSGDLTPAQMADVKARCDIIVANPDRYDASFVTFCNTNASALSEAGSDKGSGSSPATPQ
jgi:hypothetical protein